ncbi:SGNH/GDSL hydrolase family protein [Nocardia alni]|uniref:SGNH/GDSL hydrolase family protein n=1 Tax=Nocardia alni TaxID=2815723 RepID=UPI001C22BA3A|nr:SGNH/GDSL hydrolase family protein [Nocardia alni]
MIRHSLLALGCALAAASAATLAGSAWAEATPAGTQYVAMGSSYASGPGLPDIINQACMRSAQNYPHQVAAATGLRVVDVSCSGAITANILNRPQHTRRGAVMPPQIAAVTTDTRLVTVSIGGNDLNLVGSMLTDSSCAKITGSMPRLCEHLTGHRPPTAAAIATVERSITTVISMVRARAPHATVMLIQYLPAFDKSATTCAAAPMPASEAATVRQTYDDLFHATGRVAAQTGATVISVPDAEAHTACSADPWVAGYVGPPTAGHAAIRAGAFHPNLEGTTRIAQQIIARLRH